MPCVCVCGETRRSRFSDVESPILISNTGGLVVTLNIKHFLLVSEVPSCGHIFKNLSHFCRPGRIKLYNSLGKKFTLERFVSWSLHIYMCLTCVIHLCLGSVLDSRPNFKCHFNDVTNWREEMSQESDVKDTINPTNAFVFSRLGS